MSYFAYFKTKREKNHWEKYDDCFDWFVITVYWDNFELYLKNAKKRLYNVNHMWLATIATYVMRRGHIKFVIIYI